MHDFHDFDDFVFVSGPLALFPEGPKTLRDRSEGPRTLWACRMVVVWWSRSLTAINLCELKGLRPLPPTPADSRISGFFDFSINLDFWDFPVEFGVWEGLQSIGNGCGLQMDGFLAH